MNFDVGDKVKHIEFGIGVIKHITTDYFGEYEIVVEFEKEKSIFHTCNGLCKEGHGWWCSEENLELFNEPRPEKPLTKTEYNNLIGLMADEIYSLSKEAYPHTDIWKDTNEIILCFIKKLKK